MLNLFAIMAAIGLVYCQTEVVIPLQNAEFSEAHEDIWDTCP